MLKQLPKFLLFSLVSLYGCSSALAIEADKNSINADIHNSTYIANKETSTPQKQSKYTGIVGKVDAIAEQITVKIDSVYTDGKKGNGSGVIVARQGNTYYVLTAKHVICTQPSVIKPDCEHNGTHKIVTHDGVTHQLDNSEIEANQAWLDIAIVSFESSNDYQIANIGKYQTQDNWIFVSGFPINKQEGEGNRIITGGRLFKDEQEEFVTKDNYSIALSKSKGNDGLLYTNISYHGMSGGAILDTTGRLIGIHTGAEQELNGDKGSVGYEIYNLGFSLGESVTDFLAYLSKNKTELKLDWLNINLTSVEGLQPDETINLAKQLLTVTPPQNKLDLVAWMNYGNQLWRYGKYEEAVAAFKRVLEINPEFDRAYYSMGLAYSSQEEYKQAIEVLTKATTINENLYYYWRRVGSAYSKLGLYVKAIDAYALSIETNPNDFVLYVEYGEVLSLVGKYDEAVEAYNRANYINPLHPLIYNNRGSLFAQLEVYDKALNDLSKAISINPSLAQPFSNRSLIYARLADYDKAIADLNRAISINPNLAEARFNVNNLIVDFNPIISINSHCIEDYYNRGLLFAQLKVYDKAIADFNQAISITPQCAEAYYNRGNVYAELQEYSKAIRDYSKTLETISPGNARQILFNRGQAYFNLGQYSKAVIDYTSAINLDSQFAEAYLYRGIALVKLGELKRGKENIRKGAELYSAQDNKQLYNQSLRLLEIIEEAYNKYKFTVYRSSFKKIMY